MEKGEGREAGGRRERMKGGKRGRKRGRKGKGGKEETKDKGIPSILLCFLGQLHSPPSHDVAVERVQDALVCQL